VTRAQTIALGFLLALGGCTPDGILELQIELPAAPAGETWYAQVQVRDVSGHPLSIPWMGGDPDGLVLGSSRRWDCIAVRTLDESKSVHVRVRFCRDPRCLSLDDADPPERLFLIERPFHQGASTYLQLHVPRVPECSRDAECDVGVCIEGRCSCERDADCRGLEYAASCVPQVGCVAEVGRCEVSGCIEGVSRYFCSMETGEHFCERNPHIDRSETWACGL